MTIEIHTIRYGTAEWLLECAATLDSWAGRHGYPVRIWSTRDQKEEYPCLKFCTIDMWKQFLEGDSEWCMYVDGDVYVRRDAPAIDFNESGMYAPRSQRQMNARFPWLCRRMGVTSERIETLRKEWWFRNMGFWIVDRDAADKLLRVVEPPYHEATLEECQANYWMIRAREEHGLQIRSPPRGWINYYWLKNPSWMWHLARPTRKMEKLLQIKQAGRV